MSNETNKESLAYVWDPQTKDFELGTITPPRTDTPIFLPPNPSEVEGLQEKLLERAQTWFNSNPGHKKTVIFESLEPGDKPYEYSLTPMQLYFLAQSKNSLSIDGCYKFSQDLDNNTLPYKQLDGLAKVQREMTEEAIADSKLNAKSDLETGIKSLKELLKDNNNYTPEKAEEVQKMVREIESGIDLFKGYRVGRRAAAKLENIIESEIKSIKHEADRLSSGFVNKVDERGQLIDDYANAMEKLKFLEKAFPDRKELSVERERLNIAATNICNGIDAEIFEAITKSNDKTIDWDNTKISLQNQIEKLTKSGFNAKITEGLENYLGTATRYIEANNRQHGYVKELGAIEKDTGLWSRLLMKDTDLIDNVGKMLSSLTQLENKIANDNTIPMSYDNEKKFENVRTNIEKIASGIIDRMEDRINRPNLSDKQFSREKSDFDKLKAIVRKNCKDEDLLQRITKLEQSFEEKQKLIDIRQEKIADIQQNKEALEKSEGLFPYLIERTKYFEGLGPSDLPTEAKERIDYLQSHKPVPFDEAKDRIKQIITDIYKDKKDIADAMCNKIDTAIDYDDLRQKIKEAYLEASNKYTLNYGTNVGLHQSFLNYKYEMLPTLPGVLGFAGKLDKMLNQTMSAKLSAEPEPEAPTNHIAQKGRRLWDRMRSLVAGQ